MALDLAQMVLDVRKNLKPAQLYMLHNLCFNNFGTQVVGASLLLACSWPSMALGFAQMVLDVQKNFELTHIYMLNNFAQKSSPGGVIAPGLLLAVYGPGLGPDGP